MMKACTFMVTVNPLIMATLCTLLISHSIAERCADCKKTRRYKTHEKKRSCSVLNV